MSTETYDLSSGQPGNAIDPSVDDELSFVQSGETVSSNINESSPPAIDMYTYFKPLIR